MTSKKQHQPKSHAKSATARPASSSRKAQKPKLGKTGRYLLYGGLAAAALYGIVKVPAVRTMAIPFIGSALTSGWGNLRSAMQRA